MITNLKRLETRTELRRAVFVPLHEALFDDVALVLVKVLVQRRARANRAKVAHHVVTVREGFRTKRHNGWCVFGFDAFRAVVGDFTALEGVRVVVIARTFFSRGGGGIVDGRGRCGLAGARGVVHGLGLDFNDGFRGGGRAGVRGGVGGHGEL